MQNYRVMLIDFVLDKSVYIQVTGTLSTVTIEGVERTCIRNEYGVVLIVNSPSIHIEK